ncbi:hypothetical protein EJ06DRAFT_502734 [Trichodelitschia bisporula]|uniref:DNA mismatch repair protein MSH3 n=1 Tax=Trichodelitschia bisporula TaxID=703511 RepID=A0A6G1IBR3_9PEZI|nr:hypothetical protein EJ06DRAFT_502734 [Trichodelitschia bisporula]
MERAATTSYTSASSQHPTTSYPEYTTTTPLPRIGRRRDGRSAAARPRTERSTIADPSDDVVCAITESRGVSPTVGLAFINLDVGRAVICQISDNQTYVRTRHKLEVNGPSRVLMPSTAANPPSKLFHMVEGCVNSIGSSLSLLDRRYYDESSALAYIRNLAIAEDLGALDIAAKGNYFAVCCFAAIMKFVEFQLGKTFPFRSLRVAYEPAEGSMVIDMPTVHSLELIQNLENQKSKQCLYGLLDETLTPMGSRFLRSCILQPSIDPDVIAKRYDAVEELTTKEDMFFATRQALKSTCDAEKVLTGFIMIHANPSTIHTEQTINRLIIVKQFAASMRPVFEALAGAQSALLRSIQKNCNPRCLEPIYEIIGQAINEDTAFAKSPLEMRNQRIYAVKSGVNGLLDVARQTYKESSEDAYRHLEDLSNQHSLPLDLKYDNARQFYIRISANDVGDQPLPLTFINVFRKKGMIECQTLSLLKMNQKISDAIVEIIAMSAKVAHETTQAVQQQVSLLFRCCDSIAMLDMLAAFAQLATSQGYVRPVLTDTLAIQAGRHPIREKFHSLRYIPNDVYATQQTRFQIITGCNMSGKSTYIRSVALMVVMAQIGSFVPATYASFPIRHQLFARVNVDDSIAASASTFAAEMRETAFIMRNIDRQSMAILDELGRGTSTRDGLTIALAIAEALVESRALVWFASHFRDLATIMAERNGCINLHLAVEMRGEAAMTMMYKIAEGYSKEEHYGLKLARVVPLPANVLHIAEEVTQKLDSRAKKKQEHSTAVMRERRRKLILSLKEHLTQAEQGTMGGEILANWLRELQREFVVRMTAIDSEAEGADGTDAMSDY